MNDLFNKNCSVNRIQRRIRFTRRSVCSTAYVYIPTTSCRDCCVFVHFFVDNAIGDEGAVALANALAENFSLRKIILGISRIPKICTFSKNTENYIFDSPQPRENSTCILILCLFISSNYFPQCFVFLRKVTFAYFDSQFDNSKMRHQSQGVDRFSSLRVLFTANNIQTVILLEWNNFFVLFSGGVRVHPATWHLKDPEKLEIYRFFYQFFFYRL